MIAAPSPIRDRYEQVLRKYLPEPATEHPIAYDADLGTLGIDSISAINLLLDLEETFEVSFPGSLLTPELFSTVGYLEQTLASLVPERR